MKTTLKSNAARLIIFTLGAAMGAAVANFSLKKKYEEITQEEIKSVRDVYRNRAAEKHEPEEESVSETATASISEIISHEGYISRDNEEIRKEESSPYIIPPEEFGETGYDLISLTYYADGILADDCDAIVEDMEDTVGFDSLNHFGDYEDDSVFVRNDERQCDYEILMDVRDYTDVVKNKPYLHTEE